ncbi:hypothetical protein KSF_078410 [Reticulibacter mediterranei]|uniref:Uncharacterized protein n=1 Tax=Reticulibacter mediterranei TaxID=2778369 RepID=A0A8J3N6P5_9CHLR|nr:hypothetical protein [Reticulibacter mediterranei]GHO97793.1 hypothetical protein KSF_078410 [Reticulibacter mediterranei]
MQIDEIMTRLERGETLMIDDAWRSYIRIQNDDPARRFVVRSVAASLEDAAIRSRQQNSVKYEVQRYGSLVEALLSLMDYEWRDASGKLTASQVMETARIPRVSYGERGAAGDHKGRTLP